MVNLRFSTGYMLTDSIKSELVFRQYNSEGFDWMEMLKNHPYRELAEEEFLAQQNQPGFSFTQVSLSDQQKFLRLQVTQKS